MRSVVRFHLAPPLPSSVVGAWSLAHARFLAVRVRQTGAREQRSPSGRGGGGSGFTPDGTGLSTGANITSDKGIVDLTWVVDPGCAPTPPPDRKSTRLNSSHVAISYAVFCLKKKKSEKL